MSTREDIESGALAYTCHCGWIETGRARPPSRAPHAGAALLWEQVKLEQGAASATEPGFKVTCSRAMTGAAVARDYLVKRGLDLAQKESVALAIFLEVSLGREPQGATLDGSRLASWSRDAGLAAEDLVRDLIGFHVAVQPGLDPRALCTPVSKEASLAISDTFGAVGVHPCDECKGPARLPAAFQRIVPARKGLLFRDWTVADEPPNGAAS